MMGGRFPILRLLVGLTVLLLLGGCATGASPTPAPPTSTPASGVETPVPAATAPTPTTATPAPTTATPAPTGSAVAATTDVSYESTDPLLWPGKLDVYTPVKAARGPWS